MYNLITAKVFVKKHYIYLLGLFFILFLLIFRFISQNEEKRINQNGIVTVCKVYYSSWLVGQSRYFCKYFFYINKDKHYGSEIHYNSKCYIGDFYKITYLSTDPNVNRIDLNHKILEKDIAKFFPADHNPFVVDSTKDAEE